MAVISDYCSHWWLPVQQSVISDYCNRHSGLHACNGHSCCRCCGPHCGRWSTTACALATAVISTVIAATDVVLLPLELLIACYEGFWSCIGWNFAWKGCWRNKSLRLKGISMHKTLAPETWNCLIVYNSTARVQKLRLNALMTLQLLRRMTMRGVEQTSVPIFS
jgi:hypothetical protein